MRRGQTHRPVPKEQLLKALESTYEDARFQLAKCTQGGFLTKPLSCRTYYTGKQEMLALVSGSPWEEFPYRRDNALVLAENIEVWTQSINGNQIFHTAPPEGCCHVVAQGQPHYEVYFSVDHEDKEITFFLGAASRTLRIKEHTDYCWKPTKIDISCMYSEQLEKDLQDPLWSSVAVMIGRRALGIVPAV